MANHGLPTDDALVLGDLLRAHAQVTPKAAALTADSHGWGPAASFDYGELDDLVLRFAAGLRAVGVGFGDRVGFLLGNGAGAEAVITYCATHRAGGVALPINGRFVPREVVTLASHSRLRALVYEESYAEHAAAVAAATDGDLLLIEVGGPSGDRHSWETLLAADPDEAALPAVGPEDMADWLYTSGTTGSPKCVMLTHANCVAAAHMLGRCVTVRADDVLLTPFPFFSSSGCHTSLLTAMSAGSHYVMSTSTRAEELMRRIAAERATVFMAVPAIYSYMSRSQELGQHDLTSVRFALHGGAPVDVALVETIMSVFPRAEVVNTYGQTESGNPGTFLPGKHALEKAGSIGSGGMPGVAVRVLDESGADLDGVGVGEICLRSAAVMQGYFENSEATYEALQGGWLRTGDLVKVDEDGFMFIHDRKKDIIIRGGHNVASIEVESALLEHAEIAEAAVVARPHRDLGEDVMAFVVPVEGAELDGEQLREFCADRIADYKVPNAFAFIDELPRNPTGKVLKRVLRERAAGVPQ